jgi:predicted nuclease of predicted toxin-antitoxin system
MRILVDMNLTPRWLSLLQSDGHETVHWSSIGAPRATDREICDYARARQMIILTNDLDFPQILAHTREAGPTVIILRGEPLTPERRGESLLQAMKAHAPELLAGAILSIDWSGRSRSRILPLS